MNNPQALHHSLLRPCVLHILRAAGYHSTRPSVLDTLTDLTARYLSLLAQRTITHASLAHPEPELGLQIYLEHVRMAMQDCGTLGPELMMQEQDFNESEDTRGVDAFVAWAMGPEAQEIRRIAIEGGEGAKDDYLTVLKKKQSLNGDEESRYTGTILGREAEPRTVKIEGSDITNLKDWTENLKKSRPSEGLTKLDERRSSILSSPEDVKMESVE
ncbi:Bromodomain associated domain protein [Blumeria hordei DH14]|uniref:Bromodomain associated domain protein n=1 Tax=Blumeria graminis f. sp. hordei (strain DH14) TaxID=546991 RepID=N1JDB4_BLUG1|nr:Bromodomain associated domain protein [Blumeria hordei DH14]